MVEFECRVCECFTLDKTYEVKEMMHGTREVFKYDQCLGCGSIQQSSIPSFELLARHYPPNYYSMELGRKNQSFQKKIRSFIAKQRDLSALGLNKPFSSAFAWKKPVGPIISLAAANIRKTDKILDVGCGSAAVLLHHLESLGFKDLNGADPFIDKDFTLPGGGKIIKADLQALTGTFDVIMMHHAFEHVIDPKETLKTARAILSNNGKLIIRIPTPSSTAFELYGADWVQMDAPRHIHLFSREGIEKLASKAGFKLNVIVDDSNFLQFAGSEFYKKNIPLRSVAFSQVFTSAQLNSFEAEATKLNLQGRGDQAGFIFSAA